MGARGEVSVCWEVGLGGAVAWSGLRGAWVEVGWSSMEIRGMWLEVGGMVAVSGSVRADRYLP